MWTPSYTDGGPVDQRRGRGRGAVPVLVTGGGTFIGDLVTAALVLEGAAVTVLVRPGSEDRPSVLLQTLGDRVRLVTADVWESSSLKGRARGQDVVIHTVGGLNADPIIGLTHHWLNFVSARNVANLCVSAGVPRLILLSTASAPWLVAEYVKAKREAEAYLERVGLKAAIIRAPLIYPRGGRRNPLFALLTLAGSLPPLRWLGLRRSAPMPADILARGVARLALEPRFDKTIYYAGDLRRRLTAAECRTPLPLPPGPLDAFSLNDLDR